MKKRTWTTIMGAVVGISLFVIGCGKQEAQPVEIAEGVDKCDICHMHVANDQHATELVLKDGKVLKFDDIGCMHEWTEKNGTEQVDTQFVRDYYTAEWLKEEQAAFAYDKTYKTPMGYGILSFQDKAAAEKFVQEQKTGTVMSVDSLKSHTWERTMSEHKDMNMDMNMNQDNNKSSEGTMQHSSH
ncbi:nitrous oxide reductase accessory protein NosL [Brevibacillus centrosporus]|uniref:nitrous oxide reductase accessory protein NosL n=1 Tax=Brevibacillus centrosporus TaxID=54910 RepID=UPI000F09BD9B|nr:nitrous oxide reductase accessory protein NosL [Brevibacillus centrosporus]MEC2132089.1 nitrous oxide reductase accessory protein NosL [Brevibacillus centrosporus]RNB68681.1 hypothetical protein EDM55_16515 [Brevibacillus centrosporus]GED31717.1 hypothetical protein BCE02nite_28580 [Brevibacillus centrosporus]